MSIWLGFVAAQIAYDSDQRRRRRGPRIRAMNSYLRLAYNPLEALEEDQFVRRFRLSKELFVRLHQRLEPYMAPPPLRSDGLTSTTKLLTAIRFMATGSYQSSIGESSHHPMTQSSVSHCLHEVIDALANVHLDYVQFPVTRDEREDIKRKFYNNYGIPGVLGCVDGTHVALTVRPENEERYFNRKGYHSLNMMLICDSDLQILTVDPSNPGATNDVVVWNNHVMKSYLEALSISSGEEFYLLGDSGYPQRTTMMTPILNAAENTPEAHYTETHIRARNVVERCIGVLKARFRCLLVARSLHYDPLTAAKIFNACCILHNMANGARLPYNRLSSNQWAEELRLTRGASMRRDPSRRSTSDAANALLQGRQVRDRLVARLWRERTHR